MLFFTHEEEILWLNIEAVQEISMKTNTKHPKQERKAARTAAAALKMTVTERQTQVRKAASITIAAPDLR